ncbi:MAG: hypothetical protein Q9186_001515 [Xanthomendoza sp. 1 TL-2023]
MFEDWKWVKHELTNATVLLKEESDDHLGHGWVHEDHEGDIRNHARAPAQAHVSTQAPLAHLLGLPPDRSDVRQHLAEADWDRGAGRTGPGTAAMSKYGFLCNELPKTDTMSEPDN